MRSVSTFDPPGSIHTDPTSINPAGAITGEYRDYDDGLPLVHGFLRASDGTFTIFHIPGWSILLFPPYVLSINPASAITGEYINASPVARGFLRARDGTITTFDPPGSLSTFPLSINPAGTITGQYAGPEMVHGFLRAPDGTTFDPPGSIYTIPRGINPADAITGGYSDANNVVHGLMRTLDGTFTTFDPPGSTFNEPIAINPAGAVTGVMETQMGCFTVTCGGSDSDASAMLGDDRHRRLLCCRKSLGS
jgi:hypothetical protein